MPSDMTPVLVPLAAAVPIVLIVILAIVAKLVERIVEGEWVCLPDWFAFYPPFVGFCVLIGVVGIAGAVLAAGAS